VESHLLIDDHQIGTINKEMQFKIGAMLTNLMTKTLKFKVGNQSFLLLQPQLTRVGKPTDGNKNVRKYIGYVTFNKAFVEQFVQELDKIHDLNLQLERSTPMIYPPAPWKNFFFGGYYLKQTKMAKVQPNFREAVKYLTRSDMGPLCNVLNILGSVKWRLNKDILDSMEYVWSIGGGLGEIPKRYNERVITPEMIKEAPFRDKLKLLKEHQQNKEGHSLRCEWLLRLGLA
jgi:DNA-directed RNA polymerase